MKPSKEQTLKKAIEKAVKNGWKEDVIYDNLEEILSHYTGYESHDIEHLIFSHDFAKAFFGEEMESREIKLMSGVYDFYPQAEWEYQLQQMVISEDPIDYLSKYLEG
jgi:hypothetical protein